MTKNYLKIFVLFVFVFSNAFSQSKSFTSSELLLQLKKLNTLGNVLYIAAHPDDENTRMITYFANEACMRTAYLSLTRGDGGQNLIGPEKAEKMGLIRTQELLAARRIDGGEQFFSRANDFGYSKNPEETLKIWGKEEILSDVVWIIRKFRPDVIITRFSPDRAGKTHGHHTSSAILAKEAFELAADKNAFPEQLEFVETWQAKRIFWNTSWWFYGTRDFDKSGLSILDVGAYNALLGKNYGEIAGESRSMHKSQGFGASETKGSIEEYLDPLDGEAAPKNILEGINTGWSRIKGGKNVEKHLNTAIESFDPRNPASIVRHLVNAREEIMELKDEFWREIKLEQVENLIFNCMGASVEAIASDYIFSPGDSMSFRLEAINRSESDLSIESIRLVQNGFSQEMNMSLDYNRLTEKEYKIKIPGDIEISNPYWLKKDHAYGIYTVEDQELIGMPEGPPDMQLEVNLKMGDIRFKRKIAFQYKWVDRVRGELSRDLIIAPPVSVNFLENSMVFGEEKEKKLKLAVSTHSDNLSAEVQFDFPKGWEISPYRLNLYNEKKGQTYYYDIKIKALDNAEDGMISAKVECEGKTYDRSEVEIDYEHIDYIHYFPKAQMPLVNIDLKKKGNLIGYVKGAGDNVPEALMQMGYSIEYLDENAIVQQDLSKFDAIITGIRAYNTNDWLFNVNDQLKDYIKNGGNMIVQYNTSRRFEAEGIGPYSFDLGRDRVTVEEAEISILDPTNAILNRPNKIEASDFENWVQERGLYFASSWSDEFAAPLQANDPGEQPSKGMLITAKYGEGHFTYTGISFFRQLPAGVPGAYRLFANLVSLGN